MPILQEEEGWTEPSHQKTENEKDKQKYHSQENTSKKVPSTTNV
jgi:hypothetical protein